MTVDSGAAPSARMCAQLHHQADTSKTSTPPCSSLEFIEAGGPRLGASPQPNVVAYGQWLVYLFRKGDGVLRGQQMFQSWQCVLTRPSLCNHQQQMRQ